MQPVTAVWVGACLLLASILRFTYRVLLHTRETVDVRGMRRHDSDIGRQFLVLIALPDGTELDVEVSEDVYDNLRVGDSMEVSYQDVGPTWWRPTAYAHTRTAAALVPGLFAVLSTVLIIWGVSRSG